MILQHKWGPMKNCALIAICVCASGLMGCASITTGQTQVVTIQTPNCPAASCELTNKEGIYYVTRTPGTVSVNRKCSEMTIRCRKDGHSDFVMSIGSSMKSMTWGNLIFGGLIGAGVDAATGAACKYPSIIPVHMDCRPERGRTISRLTSERVSEKVLSAADNLGCSSLGFVGDGAEGSEVFTATCDGERALLTCNHKGCRVSSYSVQ
jgi:hypothetical protein